MLNLKNICKSYYINETKHEILKDINLSFNKGEFVSILGPSGSGKTTLLNIIGGIDSYDSGDFTICNKSTLKYTDIDWDNYRNQKIGFVFQNYNLIDHVSIFENVKLSLILNNMNSSEINDKVTDALKKVGLLEHISKKPNQLSGGQAQRVSIARAIVNDPDVIVADEPTGALDSKNSVEIMNILKDLSKNKLVIMVTHNTNLANKYCSRIINIEDGKIISDSGTTSKNNDVKSFVSNTNKSIKYRTALFLSFKNLINKKHRTILTSFACSIGIIGIALVLSLTNGVNKYIKRVEVDSISDYPIIIERNSIDVFGTVNVPNTKCKQNMICVSDNYNGNIIKNNIKDFLKYIDINNDFKKHIDKITKSYDIDLNVYNNSYNRIDYDLFKEVNHNDYSLLYGRFPEKYDEISIIVDSNNYISKNIFKSLNISNVSNTLTYNELINNDLKMVINTDFYSKENDLYIDHSLDNEYVKSILGDKGISLKIVGIIKDVGSGKSGIGFTDKLTNYLIDSISKSDLYKEQINNKDINIINHMQFNDSDNMYEDLERKLGIYELNDPSKISIFAKDYKSKKNIIKIINDYNKKQIDKDKIKYNDMMKTIVDSLSKVLNIISFVLIGFASISLIVSSIMIAIITYISVLERTKEIGILRAIGASKKDIKKIFYSETFIEGFVSGLIAIFLTKVLNFIICIIINHLFEINHIAILTFGNCIVLILLSVLINILSGLKPAKLASNMNPVDALRCE